MRPEQNDLRFEDDTFNCVFQKETHDSLMQMTFTVFRMAQSELP